MGTLSALLRQNEIDMLMRNAYQTVDYPDGPERVEAAARQIRRALYEAALGRLTPEEKLRLIAILQPCCRDEPDSGS
jgi:hypothetical protein